jgi:membrane fusion protein (multidrug efflux system)
VIVEERTDAMLVPEEAVMSQGEQRLLSLVEQGKVRRQVVRLGLRRDGWVEVREGLRGDEQVIRSGWHKVFPGDPVRVRSAPAQAARP